MLHQPAHISMKLPKEMTIFSRILLHLDHALSMGKSTSSNEVNIISQLLINILKKKKKLTEVTNQQAEMINST